MGPVSTTVHLVLFDIVCGCTDRGMGHARLCPPPPASSEKTTFRGGFSKTTVLSKKVYDTMTAINLGAALPFSHSVFLTAQLSIFLPKLGYLLVR